MQNRFPAMIGAPHPGQVRVSGAPQSPQNRAVLGFSAAQAVHAVKDASLVTPDDTTFQVHK
jgi:hypothetical protein